MSGSHHDDEGATPTIMQAVNKIAVNNIVVFTNSQDETVRSTLINVTRTHLILEVYNPYSIIQLSEVIENLRVTRGDRVIYDGKAVVSSLVNTGLVLIVTATLTDPWKDLQELMMLGIGIEDEVEQFINEWRSTKKLNPDYQLAVNSIHSFLSSTSRWLGQVDLVNNNLNTSDELKRINYQTLKSKMLPAINELFEEFEQEANKIEPELIDIHKYYAQQELHPLVLQSPFVHRTLTKPLGYAGDYEMMNMIQRNPAEGETTYSRLINNLFTRSQISQSVINRTKMLVEQITKISQQKNDKGEAFSLLSIGCGPAKEIQDFLETIKSADSTTGNFKFSLLDFSKETLLFAEGIIKEKMEHTDAQISLSIIEESVHDLLRKASDYKRKADGKKYDLIYCAGLFDYLSDKICSRLIRLFYSWTNPGGVVLVTNMHPSNKNRYAMEFIMDWYLIYRDEVEMKKLAPELGEQEILTDDTGVNITLKIIRTK